MKCPVMTCSYLGVNSEDNGVCAGYIMMEKEPKKGKGKKPPHSACGIAKAASYPII